MSRKRRSIPKARLGELVEEAIVDAYGESEQGTALFTIIEDQLELPFSTRVLGVDVTVEKIDMNERDDIVAICTRGKNRQSLPILDLPLPAPPPKGWEWIEAYRHWTGGWRQSGSRLVHPEPPGRRARRTSSRNNLKNMQF